MAIRHLTYAQLAEIWGVSRDAARKKVEGLRLPRKLGNDGKTLVTIDLNEVSHTPKTSRAGGDRRPAGDREETAPGGREETGESPTSEVIALHAHITTLEARAVALEADLARERERGERIAAELRADADRERTERIEERGRAERLADDVADLARQLARTVDEAAARDREVMEKLASARADLAALQARPWWRRLVG